MTTIVLDALTKRFGPTTAVDHLTATIRPGRVTALLGPNGSGKTTTLRMLLGLVRPTSGSATLDGRVYADLPRPTRQVGALLEATDFHPGRSARDHLRVLAVAARLPQDRADEVLDVVGLTEAAPRRVGQFSLGMRQRLALAAALLGDPPVLVLDEPANGLDPQGIRWLREFLRARAAEGRTVLVSSHVLPEVENTADDVLVLNHGALVRAASVAELRGTGTGSVVRTPHAVRFACVLEDAGLRVRHGEGDELIVDAPPAVVGELAHDSAVSLHLLAARSSGLEEVFLSLTGPSGVTS